MEIPTCMGTAFGTSCRLALPSWGQAAYIQQEQAMLRKETARDPGTVILALKMFADAHGARGQGEEGWRRKAAKGDCDLAQNRMSACMPP